MPKQEFKLSFYYNLTFCYYLSKFTIFWNGSFSSRGWFICSKVFYVCTSGHPRMSYFYYVDYLILTGYNSTLIDVFFSVLARQFDIIGN